MEDAKKPKTVAFDFDGVISEYHGFQGLEHTGEPILSVLETMRVLKQKGYTILIYSTRGNELITDYCNKHGIPVDYINDNPMYKNQNKGKPVAMVYVDDKAVCFKGQSSEELLAQIENFKPYWKDK